MFDVSMRTALTTMLLHPSSSSRAMTAAMSRLPPQKAQSIRLWGEGKKRQCPACKHFNLRETYTDLPGDRNCRRPAVNGIHAAAGTGQCSNCFRYRAGTAADVSCDISGPYAKFFK